MADIKNDQPVKYEFNTRFFLITALIAAVGAGCAFGLHFVQSHRIEAALLDRAQQFIDEDNPRKASETLYNYLRLVPTAHEQRVLLAREFDKANPQANARVLELYEEAIPVASTDEQAELRVRAAELHYELANTRGRRHFDDAVGFAWQVTSFAAEDPDDLTTLVKEQWKNEIPQNLSDEEKSAWKWFALGQLVLYRDEERNSLTPPEGSANVATALWIANQLNPADLTVAGQWAVVLKNEVDWLSDAQQNLWSDESQRDAQVREVLGRLAGLNTEPELISRSHLLVASYLQQFDKSEDVHERVLAEFQAAILAAPEFAQAELAAGAYWLDQLTPSRNREGLEGEAKEEALAQAEQHFTRAIAIGESLKSPYAAPYYGMAEVALQRDDAEVATAQWAEGLKLDPNPNPSVTDKLVRLLTLLEELDQAEVQLSELTNSLNALVGRPGVNEAALNQARNLVGLLDGEVSVARSEYQKAIRSLQPLYDKSLPDDSPGYTHRVALSLARAFMGLSMFELAEPCLERAMNERPDDALSNLLASELQKRLGEPDRALGYLQKVANSQGRAVDWLRLARDLLAVEALRKEGEPSYDRVEEALARAEALVTDEGDETIEEPWEIDFLRINMARLRFIGESSEEGLDRNELRDGLLLQFVATEEKYPEELELKKRLYTIYGLLEQPSEQQRVYDWMKENAPAWEVLAIDAQKPVTDKDYIAARDLYRQALDLAKEDTQATRESKAELEGRIMEVIALAGDVEDAASYAVELAEEHPESRYLVAQRLFRLAYTLEFTITDPAALQLFDDWEGTRNSAARSFFEGRHILQQLEAAQSSAQRRQLLEDLDRIYQRMDLQRGAWAPTSYLRGLVAAVNSQNEAASDAFKQAIDLGDTRLTVYLRRLYSLRAANRLVEARGVLDEIQRQIPQIQQLSEFSVGLETREGELDRAVEIADQRLEIAPDDPLAHLWKGELAVLQEEPELAEVEFIKAVEFGSDDLRTWNGLLSFYLGENERAKAEETVERLGDALSSGRIELSAAKKALALGQAYENLGGMQDRVRELYEEAVELEPENPEVLLRIANFLYYRDPAAAEKYLREIPKTSIYWSLARQVLVRLLAERGSEGDWQEVGNILAEASGNKATADRRLAATLQISRSIRAETAKEQNDYLENAKEIMTQLIGESIRPDESDLAMLAVIPVRQSEIASESKERMAYLDEAINHYRELCRRAKPDPLHLAAAIEVMTARVQMEISKTPEAVPSEGKSDLDWVPESMKRLVAESGRLIDRMEDQTELSTTSQALRIRWLRMLKRDDEISAYIENCLTKKLAEASTDESRAEANLIAAELYQAVDDPEKSLEVAQQAYEIDGRQFQGVAAAKVRAGKVDEMVSLMGQIYEQIPSDRLRVAGVLSSGLVSGKPTPDDLANADLILTQAMEAYPRNVGLWASVASVRVLQGRQPEGIALLEQALLWSPDSPIVLNNLATLLIESDDSKDQKRALVLIDRAIGNLGRNPALLDTRGMVLYGLGRVDEAVNNLTQASRRREADARVHFHLAVALLEQSKAAGSTDVRKLAEEAFRRSLVMGLEDQLLTGKDLEFLQRLKMEFPDEEPKTGWVVPDAAAKAA